MAKTFSQWQEAEENIQFYLAGFSPRTRFFYLSLILIVFIAIAILPFCYVNVITRTEGIIRPAQERTIIRSLISGTVAAVYCKDGMQVKKGDTLIILRNEAFNGRNKQLQNLLLKCRDKIHDLNLLTRENLIQDTTLLQQLQTSLYQSQYLFYTDQLNEKNIVTKKLRKDLNVYTPLVKEKVISLNEYADINFQFAQAVSVFQSKISQQISQWETDLELQKKQLIDYETEIQNLQESLQPFILVAPVTGTVLMQDPLYVGSSVISAAEVCAISPDQNLIVECWLPPTNIVTLYLNQPITYSVPELRNQMRTKLEGRVTDIAQDYTLINNKPMFRIKCSLRQTKIQLQNGFTYQLGKGVLLETRFFLARKSCWQLIYQQLYDWFNPAAFSKSMDI